MWAALPEYFAMRPVPLPVPPPLIGKLVGGVALAGLFVGAVVFGSQINSAQAPSTIEFSGAPGVPQEFRNHADFAHVDVQIHGGTPPTFYELEGMQAQHGLTCSGPPASHENHTYEGAVFICANHIMTALNSSSYGEIVLTPHRILDLTTEGVVEWDISTQKMSGRDWWDVTISPFAENVALPDSNVGIWPARGLNIREDGDFILRPIVNHQVVGETRFSPAFNAGITPGTNQAAVRQKFRLTVSRTHVKLERIASATANAQVYFDRDIADLGFAHAIVQWSHHSYNPTKCDGCVPATWHWDTFSLSPSVAFTAIKANQRFADVANPVVTFPQAAPAASYLHFSAYTNNGSVEVSANGGPFVMAVPKDIVNDILSPETYMHPIPAGTNSVQIKFNGTGGCPNGQTHYGCMARDFAIWSTNVATEPTSTPIPVTSTPVPNTVVPPTLTPPPTPTVAPGTPTPTPVPPDTCFDTVRVTPGGVVVYEDMVPC